MLDCFGEIQLCPLKESFEKELCDELTVKKNAWFGYVLIFQVQCHQDPILFEIIDIQYVSEDPGLMIQKVI